MVETGQNFNIILGHEPPLEPLVVGMNVSPNGKSAVAYLEGYYPAVGNINYDGFSGLETVIFCRNSSQDVTKPVWEMVSLPKRNTLTAIQKSLEKPRRSKIPQPLPIAA